MAAAAKITAQIEQLSNDPLAFQASVDNLMSI